MPYRELAQLLQQLQAEMQRLELWEHSVPAPEALESSLPFAYDTLEFHQWLRWIFHPRLQALIDAHAPLPSNCAVAPMAEEVYRESTLDSADLIALLYAIDHLLTPPKL